MKIIGLDVGRGSAVLCCLESFPENIQQHYRSLARSQSFVKLPTSKAGVEKLLSFQPDVLVLEPTGHWYSHFWATVGKHHLIDVLWVGNSDLDKQRGSYGFVNKRDSEDALCLAATYFDPRFINPDGSKRYLTYYYDNHELIAQVRERFLEKEQLQKIRMGLIAQLRQRLAFEYPEAVNYSININANRGYSTFVGWLANSSPSTLHDNKYRRSVAHDLEIKISLYSRSHAQAILFHEKRLSELADWFLAITKHQDFQDYMAVFDRFGFGINLKILLLYHCYPFEKFLVNGLPWIERELNKDGKLQKRDRSLRKFQSYLGLGYRIKQSGELDNNHFGGSKIVRSHLYIWAVCQVAPKKQRIKGKIGDEISARYQELRKSVKGKDALIRILFKTTRMLYRQLLISIRS
jgi:hypothetical protein